MARAIEGGASVWTGDAFSARVSWPGVRAVLYGEALRFRYFSQSIVLERRLRGPSISFAAWRSHWPSVPAVFVLGVPFSGLFSH